VVETYKNQPEDVKEVLVEMCLNLGFSGPMKFHKMWACLAKGDREGAADEMMFSLWASQVRNRAEELAAIVRGE
jgi:lysozyme